MKKQYSATVLYGRSYEEITDKVCELGLVCCDAFPIPFLGLHFWDQTSLVVFTLRFGGEIEIEDNVAIVPPKRVEEVEEYITTVINDGGFERFEMIAVEFWDQMDEQVLDAALMEA